MKAKEFIPQSKPRNFVVKNQKTAGAGAHKDKKRAEKQGDVKHKQKQFAEEAAGVGIVTKQNATADVPVGGEYMNVKKLFPKKKKVKEQGMTEFVPSDDNQERWYSDYDLAAIVGDKWLEELDLSGDQNPKYLISTAQEWLDDNGYGQAKILQVRDKEDYLEWYIKGPVVDLSEKDVEERVRDPEDWDEGNTEPGNNFAIYINGKKWKVFPGPAGAYADSPEERREFQRLKDMAARKSAATGKKWEVYITGEPATK
jgi:hypothetical protein